MAEKSKGPMAWFYEIRSSSNAALKRDGGYSTQDAAKIAGREDAKKLKNARHPDRPDVGHTLELHLWQNCCPVWTFVIRT